MSVGVVNLGLPIGGFVVFRRSIPDRAVVVAGAVVLAVLSMTAYAPTSQARTPARTATATPAPGTFTPLTPARLLDTRTGAHPKPVGARAVLALTVAGRGGVPALGSVAAVAINVTATRATRSGNITVYPTGTRQPTASNLNYLAGHTIANQVMAKVGTGGRVELANNSAGTTDLVVDVTGYYAAGTPAAAGTFAPLAPYRALDTRYGVGTAGGARVPVPPRKSIVLTVTGNGTPSRVPATGVAAVALNVTATRSPTGGNVTVYPYGSAEPTASNLNYAPHQTVANLVIAKVGSGGRIEFTNNSGGPVDLVADVAGYVLAGAPELAGAYGAITPARILDTRYANGAPKAKIAARHTLTLSVLGRGAVPIGNVAAVAVNVTVTGPTRGGNITVYPAGAKQPTASNLNFAAGQTVPNLALAELGSSGRIEITNNSDGTIDLLADVTGYYLDAALPVPPTSPGYYLRTLTGAFAHDQPLMDGQGCADATAAAGNGDARAGTVVLDFGAQTTHDPVQTGGVLLSATSTRILYSAVVTAVQAYIGGWSRCAPRGPDVTVAVATNSDGEWTAYTAQTRANDWLTKVVAPSQAGLPAGVTVIGASDIEAGFAASEAQAAAWVTQYTVAAGQPLLEIGSADGCPATLGTRGVTCGAVPVDGGPSTQTWTQQNYYDLAHGIAPTRIRVLPQVYVTSQAVQWADIDRTGLTQHGGIAFAGSLTEHGVSATGSMAPDQGWATLFQQLSTDASTSQALADATDLSVL